MLFCGRLLEFSKPRPPLPGRSAAGRIVPALKERVGMCEAPRAGVLRATTARFWMEAEGVATRPLCSAPKKLCRVGEPPIWLLSARCAPRSDASVTWKSPRLTRPPPTKLLCDVKVAARALCAYA